jgi:hypothetical protein
MRGLFRHTMDWQVSIGVGLSIFFGFLQFAVKNIPQWITLLGMGTGVCFIIWGLYSKWRSATKIHFATFMIFGGRRAISILALIGSLLFTLWYISSNSTYEGSPLGIRWPSARLVMVTSPNI